MAEDLESERRAMNAAVRDYMSSSAIALEEVGYHANQSGELRASCPYPEDDPLTPRGTGAPPFPSSVSVVDGRAAWLRGWDRAEGLKPPEN